MAANKLWVLPVVALLIAGCSGGGAGISAYPDVAPIVDSSLPESLRASGAATQVTGLFTTALTETQEDDIANALENFFLGMYGKQSGDGVATGFLNAGLEDLDARMAEIEGRFSNFAPDCVSATPTEYPLDLEVHPAFTLTMNFYCVDLFGGEGDQSGPGSGMAFGEANGTYSLLLLLNRPDEEGALGYAANVHDVGGVDERVEIMTFHTYPDDESTISDQIRVSRAVAKPGTDEFEILVATIKPKGLQPLGGEDAPAPPNPETETAIGCGLRMVSDANQEIVAEGWWHTQSGHPDCDQANNQQELVSYTRNDFCLNADTLASTGEACTSNAPEFTLVNGTTGPGDQEWLDWRNLEDNITTVTNAVQLSNIEDLGVQRTQP